MSPKPKFQIGRWLGGATVLGLAVLGFALVGRAAQNPQEPEHAVLGSSHANHQARRSLASDFANNLTAQASSAAQGVERLVLPIAETPFTPDVTRRDDYHCFLLDPKLTRDVMVTGVQIIPGNRRTVHHAIIHKVEPSELGGVLAKAKEAGRNDWSCFGGPGIQNNIGGNVGGNWMSVWVPGAGDGQFPQGIGQSLVKNSRLILEVHYNLNNDKGPDLSKIELTLAPEGARLETIGSYLTAAPVEIPCPDNLAANSPACNRQNTLWENAHRIGFLGGLLLPAGLLSSCNQTAEQYQRPVGDASRVVNFCDQLVREDTTLYSIGGHMHLLGKSIKIELNPDTVEAKTLMDIPRWDFNWQGNYWFKTPVKLKKGDFLRTTCVFDNSVANQPVIGGEKIKPKYVLWSEATADEMCLGILMASR